jgi:hypothetical protein
MEKIQSQRNFDLIMEKMRNGKKKCMKKFINGLILISFLDKINKLLSKFYDDIQQTRLSFTLDYDTDSIIATYPNPHDLYALNIIMHPFAEYFTLSYPGTLQKKYTFQTDKIKELSGVISQHYAQLQKSLKLYSDLISLLKKEEFSIYKFIKHLKDRFGSEIIIPHPTIRINEIDNVPVLELHLICSKNPRMYYILCKVFTSMNIKFWPVLIFKEIFVTWNPYMIAETIIDNIGEEERIQQIQSKTEGLNLSLLEQKKIALQLGWTGNISTMNKSKLRKKYFALSLKLHPDKATPLNKKQAEQKFKVMKNVYETLLKQLPQEEAA